MRAPYHLLHCDNALSAGGPGEGNLLVQGDNLVALKALLPYYRGRVKCIYIDPPYNTGNEGWAYNDRVNSPVICKWLGKTVGDAASDLTRHDKWLCMMLPRLSLLRDFLRPDGAIFVSIDDNEAAHLRLLMNDVFGEQNFVASLVWEGVKKNDARFVSVAHDYIFCYARDKDALKVVGKWRVGKEGLQSIYQKVDALKKERGDDYDKISRGLQDWYASLEKKHPAFQHRHYSHVDKTGVFFPGDISWHGGGGPQYDIMHPGTGKPVKKPARGWMYPTKEKMLAAVQDDEVFFGEDENKVPNYKRYLHKTSTQVLASVFYQDRRAAMQKLRGLLGEDVFENPKDTGVLMKIIGVVTRDDDIVLDSFAGSGATAHAVLSLNKEDGGKRRFICVEMDENICANVAAKRIRAVINGYEVDGKKTEGLGGGFRYCTLGRPLFNEYSEIAGEVKFSDLAAHVFFSETGEPIPKRASGKTPLLGECGGKAVYLLFNGVLGDKSSAGGNVLNLLTLPKLPQAKSAKSVRVVYGESCELSRARQKRENIVFRQIPWEVKGE